jgi:Transcriptional regulator
MNAGVGWAELELLDRIVRAGTLGGAARTLGVDQTTVSRRLAALERKIGTPLFDRISGRLIPTPTLATVQDRLRTISEEAARSLAQLHRATAELRGHVRVTSTASVLARLLAPALGAFGRDHPGITLDFVADDRALSFERHETDIALRLGRTAEDSTRVKSLGTLPFRLCRPAGSHPDTVVRYDDDLAHLPEMRALDRCRPGARVALKANHLDILTEAAAALGAEVMLPEETAARDPRFEIVEHPEGWAERPLILMVHPERARVPSVASVARWIEATVRGRGIRPRLRT